MTIKLKDQVSSIPGLTAEDLIHHKVEESYKEIIVQDQEQNKARANELAILPQEAKQLVAEACTYSSYFPNPITKPFMRKYILAKLEFPTKGSELAQSLTELNVRLDNLFNDAYTYEKAKLEAEELELEIEELESKRDADPNSLNNRKLSIQIAKKRLEQENKAHSLNKIQLAAMARYNEFVNWKGCVEDIMQEMNVKSLDEVNFENVRMDEMAAKIKKWGELHAQGALDLTPSKFQAIDSNKEAFSVGVQIGHEKVQEQQRLLEEAQKVQSLGYRPR
jgi:hypothetical protein